ncbi:hypothetical protein HPB50_022615 [Hyalomma asiaticum]|uniref:Uncharacterized protein n=1 Tax=Hyalomma asiaticum TaxID=266040 RepID=A0ACB7TPG3_HYAAI|nr:hypothetical protein HPB50_022615 [Hyalomma asiaticum]
MLLTVTVAARSSNCLQSPSVSKDDRPLARAVYCIRRVNHGSLSTLHLTSAVLTTLGRLITRSPAQCDLAASSASTNNSKATAGAAASAV